MADDAAVEALQPACAHLRDRYGDGVEMVLAGADVLATWFTAFRITQGWEIWHEHGEWVNNYNLMFGPGIADRFVWTSTLTDEQRDEALAVREQATRQILAFMEPGTVMVFPTAPGPAPLQGQPADALEAFRYNALQLTSISGLSGLPQINLPFGQVASDDGPLPVGLSVMGGAGTDETLLQIAQTTGAEAENGIAALI